MAIYLWSELSRSALLTTHPRSLPYVCALPWIGSVMGQIMAQYQTYEMVVGVWVAQVGQVAPIFLIDAGNTVKVSPATASVAAKEGLGAQQRTA